MTKEHSNKPSFFKYLLFCTKTRSFEKWLENKEFNLDLGDFLIKKSEHGENEYLCVFLEKRGNRILASIINELSRDRKISLANTASFSHNSFYRLPTERDLSKFSRIIIAIDFLRERFSGKKFKDQLERLLYSYAQGKI